MLASRSGIKRFLASAKSSQVSAILHFSFTLSISTALCSNPEFVNRVAMRASFIPSIAKKGVLKMTEKNSAVER